MIHIVTVKGPNAGIINRETYQNISLKKRSNFLRVKIRHIRACLVGLSKLSRPKHQTQFSCWYILSLPVLWYYNSILQGRIHQIQVQCVELFDELSRTASTDTIRIFRIV